MELKKEEEQRIAQASETRATSTANKSRLNGPMEVGAMFVELALWSLLSFYCLDLALCSQEETSIGRTTLGPISVAPSTIKQQWRLPGQWKLQQLSGAVDELASELAKPLAEDSADAFRHQPSLATRRRPEAETRSGYLGVEDAGSLEQGPAMIGRANNILPTQRPRDNGVAHKSRASGNGRPRVTRSSLDNQSNLSNQSNLFAGTACDQANTPDDIDIMRPLSGPAIRPKSSRVSEEANILFGFQHTAEDLPGPNNKCNSNNDNNSTIDSSNKARAESAHRDGSNVSEPQATHRAGKRRVRQASSSISVGSPLLPPIAPENSVEQLANELDLVQHDEYFAQSGPQSGKPSTDSLEPSQVNPSLLAGRRANHNDAPGQSSLVQLAYQRQPAQADGDQVPTGAGRLSSVGNHVGQYAMIAPSDDDLFLASGSLNANRNYANHQVVFREDHIDAQKLSDHWLETLTDGKSKRSPSESTYDGESHDLADNKLSAQTIYFGGFFPWLAGSGEEQFTPDTSASTGAHHPRQPNQSFQYSLQGVKPNLAQKHAHQHLGQVKGQHHEQHQRQYENRSSLATQSQLADSLVTSNAAGSRYQLGRFLLPAVRLALDHINKNSTLLGSYRLEIVPRDTQCNATISLKKFFDMVYEEPRKMLLYGDACRVSTDPIAKASYFFDLIQISYADTDPIYTIENYPNFFRVVPSENALSLARIPFIRHFNWTRVGTIYQNLPRYSLPHSKLLTDLERYNIVIKLSVSLPGSVDGLQNRDLGDELRKLKDKDVRIILGNFDEEWALLLFCEAFREKMVGRKYQWILTGVSEDKLWQYYKRNGSPCSEQELLLAMDGYIITAITPVTRSQHPTISGMMAHEYSREYRRRAYEMNISPEENKFYGYVYDGIWAIALALHRVDYQLKYYNRLVESGQGKLNPEIEGITSLMDFDYHKPIWVKLIRNALNRTRFDGVTGTVSFHKNERLGLISFSQFQAFRDMNEVPIGSYDALNDILDLKVGFPIFWRGSSPPIDYTIQRVTPFRINRTIFVIISILALFGIVLAIVFLSINIRYRDQRYIKMSSPYLNNLIIIGCILTYTSVIILGLDSGLTSEYNFPYICNARAWVLMAGFTLAFGSMFSKTFRVHSIFTNIKLHKRVIKDYKLFMVVFILLTLDVCILIVWQYFDPFYRETNNGTTIQDMDNEDIIIIPEMEHCQSRRMTIFLSVIYVYKGLLMAFGCFLAWETRHVSIPALNDSKYIGLSVYNVVIMCVIGASLSFVLRDQQDASFVIISIFIIFCSTTTLCLVFVPKVRMLIELKQNPRAGDQRVRATLKTFKKHYQEDNLGVATSCRDAHGNIIGRGYGINLNERIKLLSDENIKSRSTLKEKTYELEALTHKYRKIQNMAQSGNYLQAVNIVQVARSANASPLIGSTSVTSNLPTSIQLTGRSPTQERVSFSLTREGKTNIRTSIPQEKDSLRKSPIMSSATQLTTTNTGSSTNYTTDMTVDFCSSRLISNTTTSTNGARSSFSHSKSSSSTFYCSTRQSKLDRHATFTSNANRDLRSPDANCLAQLAPMIGTGPERKMVSLKGAATVRQFNRCPTRLNTDSSYCSMGAENEFIGSRRSQDDSRLSATIARVPGKSCRIQARCRTRVAHLNRWLQGPFCTVMVRSKSPQVDSPPDKIDAANQRLLAKQADEILASCPNIASKLYQCRSNSTEKDIPKWRADQTSLQSTLDLNQRGLARTLSMIEYLGLDEFNLIAKRHENLENRQRQAKGGSCCTPSSCSCCNSLFYKFDSHHICSEGESMFSSSDPMNSAELVRTGSRLSCSTCCSLNSQLYASHSELADESVSLSSRTTSASIKYTTRDSSSRLSSPTDEITQHGRLCQHHSYLQGDRHNRNLKQDDKTTSSSTTSSTSLHPNRRSSLRESARPREQVANPSHIQQTQVEATAELTEKQKYSIRCDILENL